MSGDLKVESRPGARWRGVAAVFVVGSLVLSACAPEAPGEEDQEPTDAEVTDEEPDSTPEDEADDEDEDDSESAPDDEDEDPLEDQDPEIEAQDGFWRLNTLPEPVAEAVMEAPIAEADGEMASAKLEVLSFDSDGDHARLVFAWLPPEDGPFLGAQALQNEPGAVAYRPFMRLLDQESGIAHFPLLNEDTRFDSSAPPNVDDEASAFEIMDPWRPRRTCICSEVVTENASESEAPETIELAYLDFPLPESGQVDLLPAQWHEPIEDVPLSEDEPFEYDVEDELTEFTMPSNSDDEPSETYGAGAEYSASLPIQARSQSLTGVSTTIDGDTQEVSLPGDVLFEFGESTLTSDAEQIIEDAAQKLNDEATGQTVIVEGHTDNVDGHDINQPLSEDRADAVAEAVEPLLDDDITIETEGHSYNRPLVPNQDAAGNDLPDNREVNRRVSFRYTMVEESDVTIDAGYEELDELPEAEETDTAEGALASYIIEAPEDDRNENDVRLDLIEAQREDDTVTLRLGIANTDGADFDEDAFDTFGGGSSLRQFGRSTFQDGSRSAPNMLHLSLVDTEADQQYFPVSLGDQGCLCSERLSTYEGLGPDPVPAYAQFQLPEDLETPLNLRVPDGGEIQLPEELLDQIQN